MTRDDAVRAVAAAFARSEAEGVKLPTYLVAALAALQEVAE